MKTILATPDSRGKQYSYLVRVSIFFWLLLATLVVRLSLVLDTAFPFPATTVGNPPGFMSTSNGKLTDSVDTRKPAKMCDIMYPLVFTT